LNELNITIDKGRRF